MVNGRDARSGLLLRAIAILMVAATAVAGCTGSSSSPSAAAQSQGASPSGAAPSSGGEPVTLHVLLMKQAAYSDTDVAAMTKAFNVDHPNITIVPEFVAYDALHDKIVTAQVGGGGVYDLILVDTPWPAEMVKAGIITDITDKIPSDFTTGVFDAAWTAAKYNGKIYGVPWINDTKFFFYNEKLLGDAGITTAPKTWDEVEADAKAIKAKGEVKYPIIASWKQAEAVICEWTQLAAVMGGSDFVDAQGNAKFNQGGGLAALKFMKKMLDEGLVDPASLGSTEDDVNAAMQTGKYAMTLNWTYGLSVMNDPKASKVPGQIKVAPSPGEGSVATSGVNGGMSLAVTTTSKHPRGSARVRSLPRQREVAGDGRGERTADVEGLVRQRRCDQEQSDALRGREDPVRRPRRATGRPLLHQALQCPAGRHPAGAARQEDAGSSVERRGGQAAVLPAVAVVPSSSRKEIER